MLYITTSPISLVSYHVKQLTEKIPECFREIDNQQLLELLSKGNPIKPATLVIELKGDSPPKDIRQSAFNTTYLIVRDTKGWEELEQQKEWIKVIKIHPEIYKKSIEKLRVLFEPDAFDWFWNFFKWNPKKLESELTILMMETAVTHRRVCLEDLILRYEVKGPESFRTFQYNLGSPKGTQILRELPTNQLWSLLIGTGDRKPYVYHYLVNSEACPEIYHYLTRVHRVVKRGRMDLRLTCLLFNQWLIEVGVEKKDKKLIFNPTPEDIRRLEELIY